MSDTSTAGSSGVPANPPAWRPLRDKGAGLVVGVNFDAGHGDASLSDLAEGLGDRRVWESVPPPAAGDFLRDSEPEHYLRPWFEEIAAQPDEVEAVLGCCAGASLAVALATRIRRAGLGDPLLIVFDPIPVRAEVIAREFSLAVDSLAAHLDAEQLRQVRAAASAAENTDATGLALVSTVAALETSFRSAVHAACLRLRVLDTLEQQLGDRFAAYLGYLLACSRAQAAPSASAAPGPESTAVVSEHHDAAWPGAGDGGRTVRFAAAAPRLLADAEVAAFVSESLEGRRL
jgi:thioesterase domain-containing protein